MQGNICFSGIFSEWSSSSPDLLLCWHLQRCIIAIWSHFFFFFFLRLPSLCPKCSSVSAGCVSFFNPFMIRRIWLPFYASSTFQEPPWLFYTNLLSELPPSHFVWRGILGSFLGLDTSQGKLGKRTAPACILVLVLSLSYLHLFCVLIYLCTVSSAVLIIFSSPVLRLNCHFYLFADFNVLKGRDLMFTFGSTVP